MAMNGPSGTTRRGSRVNTLKQTHEDDTPWKNIETYQEEIFQHSLKTNTSGEVSELLEKTTALKHELFLKNLEFEFLESLAMESDDENISELRNQLFSTVKLIHNDDLKELMREYENRDYTEDRYYGSESSMSAPDNIVKESLMARARGWFMSKCRTNSGVRKKTRGIINQRIIGHTSTSQTGSEAQASR